jgi:hypothetical protein
VAFPSRALFLWYVVQSLLGGGGGDDDIDGDGETDRLGEIDGLGEVDGLGEALVGVGDAGVGELTPPVQTVPLSVKLVGAGLALLFHEPLNPKDVLALVPMLPL